MKDGPQEKRGADPGEVQPDPTAGVDTVGGGVGGCSGCRGRVDRKLARLDRELSVSPDLQALLDATRLSGQVMYRELK